MQVADVGFGCVWACYFSYFLDFKLCHQILCWMLLGRYQIWRFTQGVNRCSGRSCNVSGLCMLPKLDLKGTQLNFLVMSGWRYCYILLCKYWCGFLQDGKWYIPGWWYHAQQRRDPCRVPDSEFNCKYLNLLCVSLRYFLQKNPLFDKLLLGLLEIQ